MGPSFGLGLGKGPSSSIPIAVQAPRNVSDESSL